MADQATRHKVPELTLVVEEAASLRIKEGDACRHANETEKFTALAERARLDAAETERIRKERDELLHVGESESITWLTLEG
jgi:hypothetical protein